MHGFWGLRQLFVERVSPVLRKRVGLELPEVFLLEHIAHSDLSPSEIAAQMRLPAHAISRRLDALEKRRLLTRGLAPEDARRRVLTLTPAGETLLEVAAEVLEQQVTRLLEVLEPDVLSTLLGAMERLAHQPGPAQPLSPTSTPRND